MEVSTSFKGYSVLEGAFQHDVLARRCAFKPFVKHGCIWNTIPSSYLNSPPPHTCPCITASGAEPGGGTPLSWRRGRKIPALGSTLHWVGHAGRTTGSACSWVHTQGCQACKLCASPRHSRWVGGWVVRWEMGRLCHMARLSFFAKLYSSEYHHSTIDIAYTALKHGVVLQLHSKRVMIVFSALIPCL